MTTLFMPISIFNFISILDIIFYSYNMCPVVIGNFYMFLEDSYNAIFLIIAL